MSENIQPLKRIVIGMGIALIAGSILFVIALYHKFQQKASEQQDKSETISGACKEGILEIPKPGKLINSFNEKGKLQLLFEKPSGTYEFIIIDSCTQKYETRLRMK